MRQEHEKIKTKLNVLNDLEDALPFLYQSWVRSTFRSCFAFRMVFCQSASPAVKSEGETFLERVNP